jgi:hypothetical protein
MRRHRCLPRSVIVSTAFDGLVENRRVGGEPGHRQLCDVALERPAVQQIACDVVEPKALAQIVKQLSRFHPVTLGSWIETYEPREKAHEAMAVGVGARIILFTLCYLIHHGSLCQNIMSAHGSRPAPHRRGTWVLAPLTDAQRPILADAKRIAHWTSVQCSAAARDIRRVGQPPSDGHDRVSSGREPRA